MAVDWHEVARILSRFADAPPEDARTGQALLDPGQRASLAELARRIEGGRRMALIADEVGMGKTRIAVALVEAVRRAGGRSAIVIPAGLGPQWQGELRSFDPEDKTLLPLRSFKTFLDSFAEDEDADRNDKAFMRERRRRWREDRKLQRELPELQLSDERVLMISHNFARMQFKKGGRRRALLGEIRDFLGRGSLTACLDAGRDPTTVRAAHAIARAMQEAGLELEPVTNPADLSPDEYKRRILPLIGYGLGQFDLVVVDEAHKSRGTDSSLSRILGPVTWETADPFRLGMTATPVELGAGQWKNTIARILGRDDGEDLSGIDTLGAPLDAYVEIFGRLQREELDEDLVADFERAARDFETALSPFVLRRDKRDDPEIERVVDTYRNVEICAISVETGKQGFSRDWLRRFAAIEALSRVPGNDASIKRMRSRLPHGLGIELLTSLEAADGPDSPDAGTDTTNIWLAALANDAAAGASLYDHPTITAAVRLIEGYTARGEKVLVFGRFNGALFALTRLLDAREMLRQISSDDGHWPARGIPESYREAVKFAMRDRAIWNGSEDLEDLERRLEDRYALHARRRAGHLERLRTEIDRRAEDGDPTAVFLGDLWRRGEGSGGVTMASLLDAMEARHPRAEGKLADEAPAWSGDRFLEAFAELRDELMDDEKDEDEESEPGGAKLEDRLKTHLAEFSAREGSFARLMYGATSAQARRNLQSAFNRAASWPMVLLSQSQVGREGLNLHLACSTVVLLHSEWNPAIVEQQIGRVDRKNSLWLQRLRAWEEGDRVGEMPRINIHPVVVSGTYAEHNWHVLEERWKLLRGQLHGNVIAPPAPEASAEELRWDERIPAATPRFSPLV